MHRLLGLLTIWIALVGLAAPSLAAGCGVGPAQSVMQTAVGASDDLRLPSPCEVLGGKRVLPAEAGMVAARRFELPKATDAQWALGLMDQPMRYGAVPGTELRPPRLG
ncbi:hypothetical protein [Devosia sp.]|uniref:hypothetical protein n=1 Tax=Devosia sp. TaxID=1871048 RepID=UPI003BABCE5D